MKLQIFYELIIILITTKVLGLLLRKLKIPEVVGMLLAGLLIGPSVFGLVEQNEVLDIFAELGVVMIMFAAGTETDIKHIKSSGKASVVITAFGVVVPFALGYVVASLFNGGFAVDRETMISNMFYGVMLTATSVTITVATLKELGQLQTRVGTSILSAAVLDDIIGIVILTVFIGLKTPNVSVLRIVIRIVLFFIVSYIVGSLARKVYHWLEDRNPGTRRNIIFAFVNCLVFSFAAEKFFGLADITGAFFAGIAFADMKESKHLEHRVDIASYLMFSPVFFASIGINTELHGFNFNLLWFGLAFVAVGLISKFGGASLGAKLCGYGNDESVRVGLGMMCRAEVILITAQRGVNMGFMEQSFMPFVILLVIVSSFITPILLKLTYRKKKAGTEEQKIPEANPES
ncbi:MAG: cation:proton antiporter [Clostridia bacterium]|nr:cation:proton antiporter [Clostridia bacterium]